LAPHSKRSSASDLDPICEANTKHKVWIYRGYACFEYLPYPPSVHARTEVHAALPRAALPRPAPRLTPRRLAREAVSIVLSVKYALGLSLIVYLRTSKYLVGRQWVGRPIILCVCRALAPLRRVKNCRFGVRGAGVVFLFIAASGVSCVPVLSGAVSVSFVSTRLHSRKKESLANVVYP